MSTDLDPVIVEALEALVPFEPVEADWDDALARAGENGNRSLDSAALGLEPPVVHRRRRPWRRRLLVALVACLLVFGLVIATGAGGLRDKIVELWESGEPAPTRVVKTFGVFDVGAPEGMGTNVISGQARKVLEVQATAKRWLMMWAAPTRDGGFCTLAEWRGNEGQTESAGGTCLRDRDRRTIPVGLTIAWPSYLSGSITDPRAASAELTLSDGTSFDLPVTWISAPIDAGLFLYPIPVAQRKPGHEPAAVIVRDAGGEILHQEDIAGLIASSQPRPCDPFCGANVVEKQVLARLTTERGIPVVVWTAPASDGDGRCYWATWRPDNIVYFACYPTSSVPLDALYVGFWQAGGRNAALILIGPVGQNVATVEVHYETGERDALRPTDGFFVSEVPSSHYPIGKRPALLVGLDRQGREVARRQLGTRDFGLYPCDDPKQIGEDPDGEPILACP